MNSIYFKKRYYDPLLGPPKGVFDERKKGSKISWDCPFKNFKKKKYFNIIRIVIITVAQRIISVAERKMLI